MKLILIGGFLGSGKTTAIVRACQHLMAEGKKVAMITNDQGDQQVDSAFAKSLGINTREVSNGCYCCRYDDLASQLRSIEADNHPDLVFAESVGSCFAPCMNRGSWGAKSTWSPSATSSRPTTSPIS